MIRISGGVVHTTPTDLRQTLFSTPKILTVWNELTPLARNEWICWIISVKKMETRKNHIRRVSEELTSGNRRPCCWAGCPHR